MNSQKVMAAVQVGHKQTEVQAFNIPDIPDDAGLLKVEISGVCGSDWPDYKKDEGPRILGHEVVGYIEKVGKYAQERWGVKEGDRVALEEYLPCGHCRRCRTGEFRLCSATDKWNGGIRFGFTGTSEQPSLWGGYSQYLYLHPNSVFHKVPDHVPANQAALALPLGNGIEWTINEGGAGPGKTVLIQGPGQQGLSCVLAAKQAGADTIIVSGLTADKDRFEVAKKFGADYTIDVQKDDLVDKVSEITNGEMVDLVIDVAAGGPATVTLAMEVVKIRGTIIIGGKKHQEIPGFFSDKLMSKCITMKGVRGHSYESVERAIALIASEKYPLHEMCTHDFGLNEVDLALKTVGGEGVSGAIHVSVDPWK
ncbi:zinc-dependent alcohol dehydrogenase [Bacillus sp. Marseille-P3661]|uniref:zinc-dependent alcohol dehydrogenase n=1 Tax=Bacillus sp. Marseille-P3661 TaxID=1936234 RepID=UPI000C82E4E5|nr:zinc-binding dehydrogenase [Bacillus sp. Marseille-P3661]